MGGFGMIGTAQLNIPGMPSGVLGTGYWNTQKMGLLSSDLDLTMHSPTEFNPDTINNHDSVLGQLQEAHRVKLTFENKTTFNLGGSPVLERQYENLLINHANTVMKLDLLGYDVYFFRDSVSGIAEPLPTLMKERLMNSMLFHKFEYYRKLDPSSELHRMMSVLVFKVLYIIGGYAHPEMSLLLRHEIKKTVADLGLQATYHPTPELMAFMHEFMSEFMDENMIPSMAATILQPSIPSVASVLGVLGQESSYVGPYGPVQLRTLRNFIYKGGWREFVPELPMSQVVTFLKSAGDDLKIKYGAAYTKLFLGPDVDLKKHFLVPSSVSRFLRADRNQSSPKPGQVEQDYPLPSTLTTFKIGVVPASVFKSKPPPPPFHLPVMVGPEREKEMKKITIHRPVEAPGTTHKLKVKEETVAPLVHLLGSMLDKPPIDIIVSRPPDWAGKDESEVASPASLDKALQSLYSTALAQYITAQYKKVAMKRSIMPALQLLSDQKGGIIIGSIIVKDNDQAIRIPFVIKVGNGKVLITRKG
jgi:hypothetical protein